MKRIGAVLILIAILFAVPQTIPIGVPKEGLIVLLDKRNVSCSDSPCVIAFSANVTNPTNQSLDLYFAEGEDVWRIINFVGNISAKEKKGFNFSLRFEYTGATTYVARYAIISDNLLKGEFTITENWEQYFSEMKGIIFYASAILTPILVLAIVFVLYIITRKAEFPTAIPERPLMEKASFLMTNPTFWAFVLVLALIMMAFVIFSQKVDSILLAQISALSVVAAFFIPILFMAAAWYGDIFEREPVRMIIAAFVWGIFAAFAAFFFNSIVMIVFNITDKAMPIALITVLGALLIAPIVEEFIKSIGILVLAQHPETEDTLDGLLYGFAIGAGFTAIENWFYFVAKVTPIAVGLEAWTLAIIYRSVFNTIAHGCFTAFIGALIGMAKATPKFRHYSYLAYLPGLSIAILLHLVFNFSALLDVVTVAIFKTVVFLFNPVLVLLLAIVFIGIYAYGLFETKNRLATKAKPI